MKVILGIVFFRHLCAGIIQFIPADGPTFGDVITSHPELAGVIFTGSSK